MATQIGPKIGIEGEKEYRQQIQQIINQTRQLDSAMDVTASAWSNNTSQMTKNRAVAQNLTQQIALYQQKLVAMNAMLEASKEKFGENASQTTRWKQTIDDATVSLNVMKQQLQGLGNAADFSDLSTKMADIGTKMQNMGQSLTAVGTKMTMALTLPIAAAGAAAVNLASNMEEASSKVDVVFGSMSESVKTFADTSLEAYGISNVKAMEMLGTFGSMATSMGISTDRAADMATTLTGLAGDMASFHNSQVEVTQTALAGVFTGETEALKKFGVAMTQANLEEFAARQGKVYSKMSEGEKVMTRYQYVLESQSDAMGDYQRTQDGTANSINTFKGAVQELGVAFGQQLLPMITPVIQAITKVIQTISGLPAPVQKIITVLALLVAAIGPILVIVGTLMSSFGSIVTNAPLVASAISKIIPAFAALGATIAANIGPIILIVAALAAIAGVAYLVVTNWDSISEAASNLGDSISDGYKRIVTANEQMRDNVKSFAENLIKEFAQIPGKVVEALRNAIDRVKQVFDQMVQNAKQSGKDFVQGFVDGIKAKVQKVVEAVKKIATTVKEYLGFSCPDKGPLHEYETWMPDFMMGLAKGIRGSMGYVKSAVNDVAKTMSLPLDSNAQMNMALAGAGSDGSVPYMGGTSMNVYVDHISELSDLIRIQNQAQQMLRMGAR